MRYVFSLFLMFVVFSQKNIAPSDYESAANDEVKARGSASAACKIVADNGYGSGVLVKHKDVVFVITAKHIVDPKEVKFNIWNGTEFALERYPVKSSHDIEPGVRFNTSNDVSVLFLERYPAEIVPLSLSTTELIPGEYFGYGYGVLLQKGIFPFFYHEKSSGTLKKISVQATIQKQLTYFNQAQLAISKIVYGSALAPDKAQKSKPFITLRSEFTPEKLRHPVTSGFSGGGIVNSNQEVVGLIHTGASDIRSYLLYCSIWAALDIALHYASYNDFNNYTRYLSTYFYVEQIFGYIRPSLVNPALLMYGLLNCAFYINMYFSETVFSSVAQKRAVAVNQILPEIEKILEKSDVE